MRRFAPQDYRLLLDVGVLYARTGQPAAAAEALGLYIKGAADPAERRDAELLLRQLNEILN